MPDIDDKQQAVVDVLWLTHLIALAALLFPPNSQSVGIAPETESQTQSHESKSSLSILSFSLGYFGVLFPILIFAHFDAAVLTLFPFVAESAGFKTALSLLMVSVIFIGDSVFQIPIGYLSDRFGRLRVQYACGMFSIVTCLSVAVLMRETGADSDYAVFIWPVLVVMGASMGGLYTLSLARIGDTFSGLELVSANAAAGIVWSLGALMGPFGAGFLMDWLGESSLMLSLVALVAIWLIVLKLKRTEINPAYE